MRLEVTGVDSLIKKLKKYKSNLQEKNKRFLQRLADEGLQIATTKFSEAAYDGENKDVSVTTEWIDDNTLTIKASGEAVLFIEFGSGLIGYGHEKAEEMGYGPGTWSDSELGKGHWQNPDGWYYEHGKKSLGNPPAMAMWEASKNMRMKIAQIAREVYGK